MKVHYNCQRLEDVKRKIREASGKDFVVEVVESIDGDRKQAQAQVDGKTVKITKGMINNSSLDEDELAGIIAHEVAHLEKRTEMNNRNREEEDTESIGASLDKFNERMKTSGLGAIIRTIVLVATIGAGVAVSKGRSRENEDAADSRAVDILHKAGYNPEALGDGLKKIDRYANRRSGFLEDVLSSHPETRERIIKIREKANGKE